jgi:hypothetical protein
MALVASTVHSAANWWEKISMSRFARIDIYSPLALCDMQTLSWYASYVFTPRTAPQLR